MRKQGSNLYTTSLISLSLAALIENLAFAMPLPYFPNYALSLGAPLAQDLVLHALASIVLPFTSSLFQATVLMFFRSFGFNISMPATKALHADLVPSNVRGKLFGRYNAFFEAGMIIGPILSTWIYDTYRAEVFKISLLSNFNLTGAGLPFIISGILGLLALGLLLIFVKEPNYSRRRN